MTDTTPTILPFDRSYRDDRDRLAQWRADCVEQEQERRAAFLTRQAERLNKRERNPKKAASDPLSTRKFSYLNPESVRHRRHIAKLRQEEHIGDVINSLHRTNAKKNSRWARPLSICLTALAIGFVGMIAAYELMVVMGYAHP